jgi:hypothetical protein
MRAEADGKTKASGNAGSDEAGISDGYLGARHSDLAGRFRRRAHFFKVVFFEVESLSIS